MFLKILQSKIEKKKKIIMFGIFKKMFIALLFSINNVFNHEKYISLSNQKCETQPTLINLHPNEYSQEFHYYPFAVKLDRCVASCNTLNDLCNKVCVPNKTENINLSLVNMITGINESKTLTKHMVKIYSVNSYFQIRK